MVVKMMEGRITDNGAHGSSTLNQEDPSILTNNRAHGSTLNCDPSTTTTILSYGAHASALNRDPSLTITNYGAHGSTLNSDPYGAHGSNLNQRDPCSTMQLGTMQVSRGRAKFIPARRRPSSFMETIHEKRKRAMSLPFSDTPLLDPVRLS